nr:hypothetical protein [Okeania sp. SIO3I5]
MRNFYGYFFCCCFRDKAAIATKPTIPTVLVGSGTDVVSCSTVSFSSAEEISASSA